MTPSLLLSESQHLLCGARKRKATSGTNEKEAMECKGPSVAQEHRYTRCMGTVSPSMVFIATSAWGLSINLPVKISSYALSSRQEATCFPNLVVTSTSKLKDPTSLPVSTSLRVPRNLTGQDYYKRLVLGTEMTPVSLHVNTTGHGSEMPCNCVPGNRCPPFKGCLDRPAKV